MRYALSEVSVPLFLRMLANLRRLLTLARQHIRDSGGDETALVQARLTADMLPLYRQVQIACDTARKAIARYAGIDAPPASDDATDLDGLMARIDAATRFIDGVPREQVDAAHDKAIELQLPMGHFHFLGVEYLTQFAVPQFLFHVSIAHGILRQQGVPVGKLDFLGLQKSG